MGLSLEGAKLHVIQLNASSRSNPTHLVKRLIVLLVQIPVIQLLTIYLRYNFMTSIFGDFLVKILS